MVQKQPMSFPMVYNQRRKTTKGRMNGIATKCEKKVKGKTMFFVSKKKTRGKCPINGTLTHCGQ